MAAKSVTKRPVVNGLIDLKPNEANVLSFVAAHAKTPSAKPHLVHVLKTSTKRAQGIGSVLLGESKRHKPAYVFMARRFADASERNIKGARILKFSLLHQGQ